MICNYEICAQHIFVNLLSSCASKFLTAHNSVNPGTKNIVLKPHPFCIESEGCRVVQRVYTAIATLLYVRSGRCKCASISIKYEYTLTTDYASITINLLNQSRNAKGYHMKKSKRLPAAWSVRTSSMDCKNQQHGL